MVSGSVIICAHNPRRDYLHRVLEALRAQKLPQHQWELLLVDNASDPVLAKEWDLSWHPQGRHIREDELGLTPARLRGIAEATGELIIFVDDDNVLSSEYLENALKIAEKYPFLGSWGGTIHGEFELQPEPWIELFFPYLAIREYDKPIWSNNPDDLRARPCGAGLCVRSPVARAYTEQVAAEPARRRLGRRGAALSSFEDHDLTETGCDLGQGFGNFPQLVMTHLIPASRLQKKYLMRLMQAAESSQILYRYFRSGTLPPAPDPLRVGVRYVMTLLRRGGLQAQLYLSSQAGVRSGIEAARKLSLSPPGAASPDALGEK